jgi:hypothetical protein
MRGKTGGAAALLVPAGLAWHQQRPRQTNIAALRLPEGVA